MKNSDEIIDKIKLIGKILHMINKSDSIGRLLFEQEKSDMSDIMFYELKAECYRLQEFVNGNSK